METFENLKVYIIAPVSLKETWKQTALDTVDLKCKDDCTSTTTKSTTKKSSIKNNKSKRKKKKDVTKESPLLGYQQVTKDSHDIEIFSWAKVPPSAPRSVDDYVVICDEAHSIQSMESTRTKDTLSLVSDER